MLRNSRTRCDLSCSTAHMEPTKSGIICLMSMQQEMIDKKLKFYVVDGYEVAKETGMGRRINTIMQTCFFSLMEQVTGEPLLPKDEAIAKIKDAIKKTYSKRGEAVVQSQFRRCRRRTCSICIEVEVPQKQAVPSNASPSCLLMHPNSFNR